MEGKFSGAVKPEKKVKDDFDFEEQTVRINKAVVQDRDRKWVVKATKTMASTRTIYVPENLLKEIKELGYIYNRHPNKMAKALTHYQDKLGIPHFRFHDLRHFYVSYSHKNNVSEADIMATGGWASNYTMTRIYRHEMSARQEQERIFNKLFS